MSDPALPRRENLWLIVVFVAALIVHFHCATLNWQAGFMPGHEFRQTQTAIVSYYIDKDNNFSPLYETPILGKPWVSILLEVPLYEWSVVGLSRLTGLTHVVAARTISLTCFYLMLPPLFMLLARFGLSWPRRLFVLALVLTCPVYIFYSRAFLIDAMELMCCAWFLLGFVRTMDERRFSWLTLTIVAGIGAALIKSVSFAVWLLPAAGYGLWHLWGDGWVRRQGWAAVRTTLWGFATVAPALGALKWWIAYTDPYKENHASAHIFAAKNLSQGNWGLFDLKAAFSPHTWSILLERWQEALLLSPWAIVAVLVIGLVCFPLVRGRIAGLAAVFFLAQLLFPFAFAYQDYYYYTCAAFLSGAFAFVLLGLWDSKIPRWGSALVMVGLLAAQVGTYWKSYHPMQILDSEGGFPYTAVIRDMAPRDSVIIVAGADWAAMIPLYTERKALMIRNGLEYDYAYLNRACDDLAGEEVFCLVLVGDLRKNEGLIKFFSDRFGWDTVPTFSHPLVDVYCSQLYIDQVQRNLQETEVYGGITCAPRSPETKKPFVPFEITPAMARTSFSIVSPAPYRGYFQFGISYQKVEGALALTAHTRSDLWLKPPAGATQITWDYGINDTAYEEHIAGKTDGVEFAIHGATPDGERRQVYSRVLDPADDPADRGPQHEVITYTPRPGETLQFSSLPNVYPNYDWAYWVKIEVK